MILLVELGRSIIVTKIEKKEKGCSIKKSQILEIMDRFPELPPLSVAMRVFNPVVLHLLFGRILRRDNGECLKTLIKELSQEETTPIDVTTIKR